MTPEEKIRAKTDIDKFIETFYARYGTTPIVKIDFEKRVPPITLDQLVQFVNEEFKLDQPELYDTRYKSQGIKCKCRDIEIIQFRRIYCKMGCEYGFSLSQVGKPIGLNHCTVLWNKQQAIKNNGASQQKKITSIENRIKTFLHK